MKKNIALGLAGITGITGISVFMGEDVHAQESVATKMTLNRTVESKENVSKKTNSTSIAEGLETNSKKLVKGRVSGNNVNFRRHCGTIYTSLGKLQIGDTIEILTAKEAEGRVWLKARVLSAKNDSLERTVNWIAADFVDFELDGASVSEKVMNTLNKALAMKNSNSSRSKKVEKRETADISSLEIKKVNAKVDTKVKKEEAKQVNKKETADTSSLEIKKVNAKVDTKVDKKNDNVNLSKEVKPSTDEKKVVENKTSETKNESVEKTEKVPSKVDNELVVPAVGDSELGQDTFIYSDRASNHKREIIGHCKTGDKLVIMQDASATEFEIEMEDGSVGYINRFAFISESSKYDKDVCGSINNPHPNAGNFDEEDAKTNRKIALFSTAFGYDTVVELSNGEDLIVNPDISNNGRVQARLASDPSVIGFIPVYALDLVVGQDDLIFGEKSSASVEVNKNTILLANSREFTATNEKGETVTVPMFNSIRVNLDTKTNKNLEFTSQICGETVKLFSDKSSIEAATGCQI